MHWIIAALVAVFGLALYGRIRGVRPRAERRPFLRFAPPNRPDIRPLEPGEVYDTTVKLTTSPNVPLAELWCTRLKEQGIEAFVKSVGVPTNFGYAGVPELSPSLPAEVWVGKHDAERALELLRELG